MRDFRRALSAVFSLVALAAVVIVQGSDQGAQQPTGQQPSGQQQPAVQAAPPAQQADQQQPPTTIRRGIDYVSVDVIVTDKDGKPVMDFTQDDFAVAEDGKPQKVDTFQIIDFDALETMESGPPRPFATQRRRARGRAS